MIAAFLQARTNSSRLPGKVLLPIQGKPSILRQIERIKQSKLIDKIVVVTSENTTDDRLANELKKENINVFRGPLDDVLTRYTLAAQLYNPTHIVRLTADCPLTDPHLIDEVIQQHLNTGNEYTSNFDPRLLPDGLDAEIFTRELLNQTQLLAKEPFEREHVTPYMRNASNIKRSGLYYPFDFSHLRWTLDTADDYQKICTIYEHFLRDKKEFYFSDILEWEKNYS